jgi:hypothetical protein
VVVFHWLAAGPSPLSLHRLWDRPYLPEYKMTAYKMTLPSQLVCRKIPLQSMFNFVYSYKVTSDFPDDELGKHFYLWGKYGRHWPTSTCHSPWWCMYCMQKCWNIIIIIWCG